MVFREISGSNQGEFHPRPPSDNGPYLETFPVVTILVGEGTLQALEARDVAQGPIMRRTDIPLPPR